MYPIIETAADLLRHMNTRRIVTIKGLPGGQVSGVIQTVAWEGSPNTYVVTFTNKATVCTRLPLE
jgi:hypothetical protein